MEHERDVSAVSVQRRSYDESPALVVEWDFGVRGGSFGEHEADVFAAACAEAVDGATPLVTVLRSGGTRLQEGMRALVGIPRATLALADLRAARVPHIAVCAAPTTGGVWVAIGSQADLRVGVAEATVGFSGPRVIEAMTGERLPVGANTAESALAAGLLDDVVDAGEVDAWIGRALQVLRVSTPATQVAALADTDALAETDPPDRLGWEQVEHSRTAARLSGRDLADALLGERVRLRGRDESAGAWVGSIGDRSVVMVALASKRAGRTTPAGFHLLLRAAAMAGHLDLPLVTLVDTAGADPLPDSEQGGVAGSIASALTAVLACSAPTIAVVHGEGGSGGALAAAVCDVVAVTADGWFAALSPEGAAAALRREPAAAADLMRVAPAELTADGFADAVVRSDPQALSGWLTATLARLETIDPVVRRQRRDHRWRGPLRPRRLGPSP
jgi:acetyl-CoA carboxylase carboxyl transferase subunit beta